MFRIKPHDAPSSDNIALLAERPTYQRSTTSDHSQLSAAWTKPSSHVYEPLPLDSRHTSYNTYTSHTQTYSLVDGQPHGLAPVWHFTTHNPWMIAALVSGSLGALGCFAFTYWLGCQNFTCPAWANECEVRPPVHFFAERLGFVQGILSTVYGICITGIVYATYQFAEATLWPMLCQRSVSLRDIDRFLAHTRGSLAAFPSALWCSAHYTHVATVLIVGLVGVMLHINSTIVGWAFTAMLIPTTLHSNHTQGAAMGFGFESQYNPPGPINGEIQRAYAMYSAWSNSQSEEMLPDLRNYVIDRMNLSAIGNFTVNAVELRKQIDCHGQSVDIIDYPDGPYGVYVVQNHLPASSYANTTMLRLGTGGFSSYVDSYRNLSATSAVTTLMFVTLNGTVEGGHMNSVPEDICSGCSGFSSLACEVTIDLVAGRACNGECMNDTASVLTSLGGSGAIAIGGNNSTLWPLTVAIAAAPTQFGPYIYGAQPSYFLGPTLPNSTLALPVAGSDTANYGSSTYFSQANITNFINVATGAVAIAMPQGWPQNVTTVKSTIYLPRLDSSRSFVLLGPPAVALLNVVLLVIVDAILHRNAKLGVVRLGSTSEILLSSSEGNVMDVIEDVKQRSHDKRASLQQSKWKFDWGSGSKRVLYLDGSVITFDAVK